MADDAIHLLQDLIAINSVNPSLVPGGAGEKQIADRVAQEMRAIGLAVEVTEVVPGRPNVIGVLEGRTKGRSLMLCGHLDTVGVQGMQNPFDPVEKEGRIYGRGSQDMKGGVAAMISAARHIVESNGLPAGSLIIAAVVDEEFASIGAEALVKKWKADGAIVLEPTDLQIGIAHKGFGWIEITTKGRAAHGSRPNDGRDAILYMGRFLSALESHNRKLRSQNPHPHLGTASLHASLIQGGRELSTYPDRCTLQFERRTLSGEKTDIGLDEAQEIVQNLQKQDPEFSATVKFLFGQPPYEIPSLHELPDLLEQKLTKSGRATQRAGMTFWTDAAILGSAGIPSVVFGPGGAGLHGIEEYVFAEEVIACRDAVIQTAHDFCRGV